MEKKLRYGAIAVLLILIFVALGNCKPVELLVATGDIYYTGLNNSQGELLPCELRIVNNLNSYVYSIYAQQGVVDVSNDLLGSFDVIGPGRITTIHGVPKMNVNIKIYFADNNTYPVTFNGLDFSASDYEIILQVDPNPTNVVSTYSIITSGADGSQTIKRNGMHITLKPISK